MESLHKYMCVYNGYLYLPFYKIYVCDNQLAGGYVKAWKGFYISMSEQHYRTD